MIEILDKKKCCGCTACMSICPKGCITMTPDKEGFLYPEVDVKNCNGCDACNKVCPVEKLPIANTVDIQAYAVRTKEEGVLKKSTSGGFITPLANWVFQNNGMLCAAAYADDFSVEHIVFEAEQSSALMPKVRGSKYVQSDLKECFGTIKKALLLGKLVCFIGTTCQVNGLQSFLQKPYNNLITVDLVCHGSPSPKLWKKYLEYQCDKYHSDVVEVAFRSKTYGYHGHTMMIKFSKGDVYTGSGRVDAMMKSFMAELASRPICYECPFKKMHRCSDFTIFDCWHFGELVPDIRDDDKGYTNLLIQSQNGALLFEKIKDQYSVYSVNRQRAIELDGKMLLNSAIPHKRRDEFLVSLDDEPMLEHIQRFIPVTKKDKLIERSKRVLYNPELSKWLKEMRSRRKQH